MDTILATNWEKVDKDDDYLQSSWFVNGGRNNILNARKLLKRGELFYGYIMPAKHLALYQQMDAEQVLISADMTIIVLCENVVVDNEFRNKIECDYE